MPDQPPEKKSWGLWRRRQILWPTLKGWLCLALLAGVLLVVTVRDLHSFLAPTSPLPSGDLIVEGWAPDFSLEHALREFKTGRYHLMYVTGGPIEAGAPLSEYKTYAQRGAATMVGLGADSNVVVAVPAPSVRQDRTYASAVAFANWLKAHPPQGTEFTLVTVGPHARRSRLLFEKALPQAHFGVIATPPHDYDPAIWYRTSSGVRTVIGELLGYLYVKVLFQQP